MSQVSKINQTENALVLRNEVQDGANDRIRVYNLIKNLIDSAIFYDQVKQVSGSSITDVISQSGVTSIVSTLVTRINGKLDNSYANTSNEVNINLVTGASFTGTTSTHFVHVSGSSAVSVWLPPAPKTGQQVIVSDAKGSAETQNITIRGNGKTINGQSTALIDSPYGSLMFIYNGINWIGGSLLG
jgi:hypothetical protein